MSKEIKDIAMWEETDSELAKYSIQELTSLVIKFEEQNKQLKKVILNQEEQLKANDLMINDLLNRIKKAIKKLNSAVDHYEDLSTDWALKCAIKILRGKDNE